MEIKHNSPKKPEISGASAQVLASLRAEKLRRTPSTIIRRHRAAKALAASRMKVKVTLDKIEFLLAAANALDHARDQSSNLDKLKARAAVLAEDRAVSLHAADLLDHARNQGSTLEMALEDFRGESELLGEMGERVMSRAYDIDAEVA